MSEVITFLVLTDSRKHNSEHRLIMMPDNLSPLPISISALFEVKSWNEDKMVIPRGTVPNTK